MVSITALAAKYSDQGRIPVRYGIGLAAGVLGLADMLSAIVPRLDWISFLGVWPLDVRFGVHSLTVVTGFFLIMLSYGLMRGKYQAWQIALLLLLLSGVLHILRGGAVLATMSALGLATIMVVCIRSFRARSDPPSTRRGYVVLVITACIVFTYTLGGFLSLYNQFEPLVDRFGIEGVILRLLTHTHLHLPPGTQAFFFEKALPCLCASAILYGMIQILRPVAATLLPKESERKQVEYLVERHGKNSISYFALSEEKAYFFARSGKAVLSYVLEGNVAVVAGDPIGIESELRVVIQEFMEYCREQDWTIVFWQVRDELTDLYRDLGMHLLKIGEDAIIQTKDFTLKGGAMANVRTSARRAEKEGVRVVFYRGAVTNLEQLAQMEHISEEWLEQKGGVEMGFSMGHFDPYGDEQQLTAVAADASNRVHAFVTFVPIYGRRGWGLDLLRRAERCAPGTMELLLARSIEHVKERGAEMISLGLAPMSNVNDEDTTALDNSIDFLTQRFGNLSKSQSLFSFKKKFQPTWESRYLVFSHTLTLPKIGWALFKAHQEDASLLRTIRRSVSEWKKSWKTAEARVKQAV